MINTSSKNDPKEHMARKENVNVIEQMSNVLRFDVEMSDESKKIDLQQATQHKIA